MSEAPNALGMMSPQDMLNQETAMLIGRLSMDSLMLRTQNSFLQAQLSVAQSGARAETEAKVPVHSDEPPLPRPNVTPPPHEGMDTASAPIADEFPAEVPPTEGAMPAAKETTSE